MNRIRRLYIAIKEAAWLPSVKRETILWNRLDMANENRRKHIEECERLQERVRVLERAIQYHKRSKTNKPHHGEDVFLWKTID